MSAQEDLGAVIEKRAAAEPGPWIRPWETMVLRSPWTGNDVLSRPANLDFMAAAANLIEEYGDLLLVVTRDRLMMALHHVDGADFRLGHDLYIPADVILAALRSEPLPSKAPPSSTREETP